MCTTKVKERKKFGAKKIGEKQNKNQNKNKKKQTNEEVFKANESNECIRMKGIHTC